MPLPRLAAVVVLDEHDERYQEERAPTWHARDVALERARRAGVPCLLVSPTPSLEALTGSRVLVPSRAEERAGWPVVEVVDRTADEDAARQGLYSRRLVDVLRSDRRVAVVLNRVGRARLLACPRCAHLVTCHRCGAALRSPAPGRQACPRCGEERPALCADCGSTSLRLLRPGVSRVREELESLAGEPVLEVTAATIPSDAATVPERGRGRRPVDEGVTADARLVVGTSAVLHRPLAPDVVVFLDLDADLLAPRYRASEQVMGQLARAARMLGGRVGGGRLLLQTRQPHHEVVQAVLHADPARWARPEAARRRALSLPPFAALAHLSGDGAAGLAVALQQASGGAFAPWEPGGERERSAAAPSGVTVLGPLQGRYLVRAPDHAALAAALAAARSAVGQAGGPVRIEVDPPDA
jgi:primosomal protein N' (replication factor Y)